MYITNRLISLREKKLYNLYMPWVKCIICVNDFYTKPRHLRRGWGKYCSRACSYKGKINGKSFSCSTCQKQVYRTKREINRSNSGNFFCNKSCFAIWKNNHILFGEQNGNWKDGENAYRSIMLRNNIKPVCGGCGLNNIVVLVVHHIDHNRKNNNISNLKWLCRNCHYIVHGGKTF